MASWVEFAESAPELAASGVRLFEGSEIAYLVTVRRNGGPLVNPLVPVIAQGRLFVFIPQNAPDDLDLRRDNRYALHAMPGKSDEEFMVNGRAVTVDDMPTREVASQAANSAIHDQDMLFELHINRCFWAIWEDVGHLNTRRPIRKQWEAGKYEDS